MRLSLVKRFLSDTPPVPLPARIEAAVHAQQDASERIIGCVQLAVVVMFGLLYAVSPNPIPHTILAMPHVEPVPWVLAAYFAFTLTRLWLSFVRRLPGWLIALSVVVDMALLLGTIWTFHLKYDQPPSFYLKAPTLLYVFIFIALRTLRFEVRYILFAGATAIAGWSILVAYVVFADPTDPMITRDYTEYLTSNSVLLGAEFDKLISIAVVTALLALAVQRARAMLETSVAEGAAARSLARYFPNAVARQIAGAEIDLVAGHCVARDAAIVNIDIRGFTPLTRSLTPEGLISLLTEYQGRMVRVIRRHGGVVDKFQGDGILATFGAVEESDTFAADALRALEDVIAEADAWNAERRRAGVFEVAVGAAAAAGGIVAGVIGDEERLEYTVIGDPVNLSAKLESHTKREGARALSTRATLEIAIAQGFDPRARYGALPGRLVSGMDEPLDLVTLTD